MTKATYLYFALEGDYYNESYWINWNDIEIIF